MFGGSFSIRSPGQELYEGADQVYMLIDDEGEWVVGYHRPAGSGELVEEEDGRVLWWYHNSFTPLFLATVVDVSGDLF